MTTADRRLAVLRAIVSSYVQTSEPVSSKAVAESHVRGVSSATIRNDMAVLEEQGLISQLHTSSGRIPTEAGYRLFVDHLTELQPLTRGQRQAIREFMAEAVDFDDVVAAAVRLLAELTQQASVLEYPTLSAEKLRRVELVDLPDCRLLVIVVTDTGRVAERRLDYQPLLTEMQTAQLTASELAKLRDWVNQQAAELPCYRVSEALEEALANQAFPQDEPPFTQLQLVATVCKLIEELTRPEPSTRMMVAGASNLARSGIAVKEAASILDALEEQVALLRLLHEVHTLPVQVSIGTENQEERLNDVAVVSATYETHGQKQAHMAIVGPTRMNYPRSLVAVRAVSKYLSGILLGGRNPLGDDIFDLNDQDGKMKRATPRGDETK